MFVASYARLAPGSGSILASTFKFSRATRYIGFLRLQSSSGLGRAVYYSAQYHLGTTSLRLGLFITMRATTLVPLGPSITMRGTASVPLGPSIHYNARYRLGAGRALYYNARYRLGTASVPLGPYYNARYRHPVCVLQSFNWIGVRNLQENTKTNRKPRNATLSL